MPAEVVSVPTAIVPGAAVGNSAIAAAVGAGAAATSVSLPAGVAVVGAAGVTASLPGARPGAPAPAAIAAPTTAPPLVADFASPAPGDAAGGAGDGAVAGSTCPRTTDTALRWVQTLGFPAAATGEAEATGEDVRAPVADDGVPSDIALTLVLDVPPLAEEPPLRNRVADPAATVGNVVALS